MQNAEEEIFKSLDNRRHYAADFSGTVYDSLLRLTLKGKTMHSFYISSDSVNSPR